MGFAMKEQASTPSATTETVHRFYGTERVRYGASFGEMLANETARDGASRIFVVTAPEIVPSASFDQLKAVLGSRFCGFFSDIPPHVPIESVLAGVAAAREAGAQLMVTLGGGSAIDATKLISLCLAQGIGDMSGFEAYAHLAQFDPSHRPAENVDWIRSIAVPTTLSAAEFTWFAGVTDPAVGMKRVVGHPLLIPRAVLYDPRLTLGVPLPVFLASGIKAVDHAAEKIASLAAQPFSDAMSKEALRMLAHALPRVAADPKDLPARLTCQLAAWLSIAGGMSGVRNGASHAIGHMLGPHASVPHGLTSCTVLASVMRWNRPVNHERQAVISAALGRKGVDAGDAIEDLVSGLRLPTRLRDIGVPRAELTEIARKTMEDSLVCSNPRKISTAQDVLEILEMAY
ncbi:iron-containing alcohol dehydrogenase [Verticiella sediminum]|nr:iron-containing alcohol dehydrogenase [Verticiella sediminum]